jgi:hypothetical protein
VSVEKTQLLNVSVLYSAALEHDLQIR